MGGWSFDHPVLHEEDNVHGEVRIQNYKFDRYDPDTRTIFELHGCYCHVCPCGKNYDLRKWTQTLEREQELHSLGYNLVSTISCECGNLPESKIWYQTEETIACTYKDIINGIMNDEIFGIIKYSIQVPEHLVAKFTEFPSIFKNNNG